MRGATVIFLLMVLIPAAASANPATAAANSPAAVEWVFQVSSGSAYNFPMPLKIKQAGQEDIELTARYGTKPWSTFAWYYDFRLGRWKDGRAWEIETHHHKIFLSNRPPEVERFSVSHGYNLNTVNRAWLLNKFICRLGAGFVVTHPETTVRGRTHTEEGWTNGFYLSGLTAQAALERRFDIYGNLFFSLEGKLTASYATIPVAGGDAAVPVTALHGILGTGYRF